MKAARGSKGIDLSAFLLSRQFKLLGAFRERGKLDGND